MRTRMMCGRLAAVLTIMVPLTNCADGGDSEKMVGLMWQSLTGDSIQVTREQAGAVPYATLGLQIGSGHQVMLVLGAAHADERDWYGGERLLVRTQAGRVVRTLGLKHDLDRASPDRSIPYGADASPAYTVLFDYTDKNIFGAAARCTMSAGVPDTINILGGSVPSRRRTERCEVPSLGWTFENVYWQDATTGQLWRSIQHIHPDLDPLTIETLRPEKNEAG